MKLKYIFSILVFICGIEGKADAQTINNANFDSLCVCAIDRIWDWVTSDTYYFSNDSAQPFMIDTYYDNTNWDLHMAWNTVAINYDNDSLHYTNSVKIFTKPDLVYANGNKFRGFITNGNQFTTDSNGYIDFSKGGSPFPYRPYSIKGLYKFEDTLSAIDEFGKVIILLKKFNTITNSIDTIGYAENNTEMNPVSTWQNFEIPITYLNNSVPDSIVVVFISSSMADMPTTLWIDDITFDFTTDIEDISLSQKIIFYPNPCYDQLFFIGNKDKYIYQLTDIYGNVLKRDILLRTIDMSVYSPGIYFISTTSNGINSESYKIIKIK